MIMLIWALKVILLLMRTPRSLMLSVEDMGREEIVYLLGGLSLAFLMKGIGLGLIAIAIFYSITSTCQ